MIGAGFIGVEVASAGRKRGLSVTGRSRRRGGGGRFGHRAPSDRAHVIEPLSAERRCTVLFERDGRASGALVMNRPAAAMKFRTLLAEPVSFEQALAAAPHSGRKAGTLPRTIR